MEEDPSPTSSLNTLSLEFFGFDSKVGMLKAILQIAYSRVPETTIRDLIWEATEDEFNDVAIYYGTVRKVNDLRVTCCKWGGVMLPAILF